MMERFRSASRLESIVLVASLASLSVNVFLSISLNRSHQAVSSCYERLRSKVLLPAGSAVPSIDGISADGMALRLVYSDVPIPTIIYYFSPSCGWCKYNLPSVLALFRQTQGKFRVVGISDTSSGLAQYLSVARLPFPVITNVDGPTSEEYMLNDTPRTLVVSREGRVLYNWSGAYIANTKREIERALKVVLPQLRVGHS